MAERKVFEVRMDPEQYRKMETVAAREGMTVNNYLLKLVRTNIAYHERIHGRIKLPPEPREEDGDRGDAADRDC